MAHAPRGRTGRRGEHPQGLSAGPGEVVESPDGARDRRPRGGAGGAHHGLPLGPARGPRRHARTGADIGSPCGRRGARTAPIPRSKARCRPTVRRCEPAPATWPTSQGHQRDRGGAPAERLPWATPPPRFVTEPCWRCSTAPAPGSPRPRGWTSTMWRRRRGLRLRGKGGKERPVPLGSYASAALAAYLVRGRPTLAGKGRNPAIFLNQRGGRLSRQSAGHPAGRPTAPASLATPHRPPRDAPSPPTSWRAAPMSGWSRSCSATRR